MLDKAWRVQKLIMSPGSEKIYASPCLGDYSEAPPWIAARVTTTGDRSSRTVSSILFCSSADRTGEWASRTTQAPRVPRRRSPERARFEHRTIRKTQIQPYTTLCVSSIQLFWVHRAPTSIYKKTVHFKVMRSSRRAFNVEQVRQLGRIHLNSMLTLASDSCRSAGRMTMAASLHGANFCRWNCSIC